ncbi:putative transcription factor interactor and regulator CCHC(Zn) family [Helianthus debilis subsp. tardiflorus]
MVCKRQKLARKKFKQEHPELFVKPEPTAPKDPNKKKKKNSKFKRKKSDPNDPSKPKRSSSKKHPLRIPGMRPGDSCFICKADNHIAKNCPEKAQWEKHKICLLCRQRGHSLKNCPDKNEENIDKKLCYNCGEFGHSLASCLQPLQDGGTKYATCFVCKQQGHISKDCPKNAHGIYPKGGCCKICSGVTHLAKDCPNKSARGSSMSNEGNNRPSRIESMARGQVTKFSSGDDLEDDFTMIDDGKEKNKSVVKADTASNEPNVKSKKKQGTKVVNFVG